MANSFVADQKTYTVKSGGVKEVDGLLTVDTYPSGGYTPSPPAAFKSVTDVIFHHPITSRGHLPRFDGAKVRMLKSSSGTGDETALLGDILGGKNTSQTASDQASEPVNGHAAMAISDADAVTSGNLAHAAGKTVSYTADYARNVVAVLSEGGAGASFAGGTLTLTGTDQFGAAITEAVTIPAVALAAGKFRWVVGAKVFAAITNAKLSAAQGAGTMLGLGLGTRLGLPKTIDATSDVKAVQKNTSKVASGTYSVSTATSSVLMGADLADNDDVTIVYEPADTSLLNAEEAASADCGTIRVTYQGV